MAWICERAKTLFTPSDKMVKEYSTASILKDAEECSVLWITNHVSKMKPGQISPDLAVRCASLAPPPSPPSPPRASPLPSAPPHSHRHLAHARASGVNESGFMSETVPKWRWDSRTKTRKFDEGSEQPNKCPSEQVSFRFAVLEQDSALMQTSSPIGAKKTLTYVGTPPTKTMQPRTAKLMTLTDKRKAEEAQKAQAAQEEQVQTKKQKQEEKRQQIAEAQQAKEEAKMAEKAEKKQKQKQMQQEKAAAKKQMQMQMQVCLPPRVYDALRVHAMAGV